MDGVAGVVLAAGSGTRLRPLTAARPKALCPVAGRALLDRALDALDAALPPGPDRLAVNAHHLAGQIRDHLAPRAEPVRLSLEQPVALGTAGALAALNEWRAGRPVLVHNADAYLPGGVGALLQGWQGERIRLLCQDRGRPADFGTRRYVGAALLPAWTLERLRPEPSGLYEVLWRDAEARGTLELLDLPESATCIDCGTPQDYWEANLDATGGAGWVSPTASVLGSVTRCVVWDGAVVGPQEHLVDAVRAGTAEAPVTLHLSRRAEVAHHG